jgi:UDP-GlcNAc:undecaprenyl-phosphate GlcNAc-1-phosphate transferase
MLLGLLLAYVPISSIASLPLVSLHSAVNRFPEVLPLLLPATILVIPYADLLLAVVRRTRAGKSPLAPDRKHLHHRLLDIGHSHRSSVLIMYLWAALFSGAIVWLSVTRTQLFVLAGTTLAAGLVLLLTSMPRLRWWERKRRAQVAAAREAAAKPPVARPAPAPAAAASAAARNGTGQHAAQNGTGQHAEQPGVSQNGTAQPAVVGAPVRPADVRPQSQGRRPGPLAVPAQPPGVPARPR